MITITAPNNTIIFKGQKGTIQLPKPVFETFTSLGASSRYVQRLREESQESRLNWWSIFATREEAWANEVRLKESVGIRVSIDADGEVYNNCIILDYTHTIRAGANGFLLEVDATVVTDNGE
jgi:hypothetical protein